MTTTESKLVTVKTRAPGTGQCGGSSRKQPKTGPRALALNGLAPGHGQIADVARGRARPAYTMRSRKDKV